MKNCYLLFVFILFLQVWACSKVPKYKVCIWCKGTKECSFCNKEDAWCDKCNGTHHCSACNGTGHEIFRKYCPECNAETDYFKTACSQCGTRLKYDRKDIVKNRKDIRFNYDAQDRQ